MMFVVGVGGIVTVVGSSAVAAISCIYLYEYIYKYIYVCVCISVCVSVYVCVSMCLSVYLCVRVSISYSLLVSFFLEFFSFHFWNKKGGRLNKHRSTTHGKYATP